MLSFDFIWFVLFGVFCFVIDSSCDNSIKTYGQIMFWTYAIYFLITSTLLVMIFLYTSDSPTSFVVVGIILWVVMMLTVVFMWLFEMIVTANWGFGYSAEPEGCEALYYLIIVNVFWLCILVAFLILGPLCFYCVTWCTDDLLRLPRNENTI